MTELLPTLQQFMTLTDGGQTVKNVTGTNLNHQFCLRQYYQYKIIIYCYFCSFLESLHWLAEYEEVSFQRETGYAPAPLSTGQILISEFQRRYSHPLKFCRLVLPSEHLTQTGRILSGIRMTTWKSCGRKEKRV